MGEELTIVVCSNCNRKFSTLEGIRTLNFCWSGCQTQYGSKHSHLTYEDLYESPLRNPIQLELDLGN